MRMMTEEELLEVKWVDYPDTDIHYKRFKRMGALLEWVEKNPDKIVILKIHKKIHDK